MVIISGYVGPKPVERLKELPIKTTVVYGMYASDGIHKPLRQSLIKEEQKIENLKVLCSTIPVHSKIYMWLNDGHVIYSLIGSANFSLNGLTTPYKESLAETTLDTFKPLEQYRDVIFNNSIPCSETKVRQTPKQIGNEEEWSEYDKKICTLPLYIKENNKLVIPQRSGLNWGMAKKLSGSHVNIDDAYIAIPADYASHYSNMFPIKQTIPSKDGDYKKNHRHNDTIEVIWDDGTEMVMLLEGTRNAKDDAGNKIAYPKQIASSPKKYVLGRYLRNRLGVESGRAVTLTDLDNYGRRDISISLQGEGIYYFDFSVGGKHE